MEKVVRIRFCGKEMFWLRDPDMTGAIIRFLDDYRQGRPSFAHVLGGRVYRYGEIIGTARDFAILEECEISAVTLTEENSKNLRSHPGWRAPVTGGSP